MSSEKKPSPQPPAGLSVASAPPPPRQIEPAQMNERLLAMHEMMIQGSTGMDLVALAQDRWGISRRTAYYYLATLKRRIANVVRGVDFALVHELSQAQRSRMIETVFRLMRRIQGTQDLGHARSLAALIAVAGKLIDDRERCARQAVQLDLSRQDPRRQSLKRRGGTNRRAPRATVEVALAPMASPPIPISHKEIRDEIQARPCPQTLAKPALDEKSLHSVQGQ